MVLRKIVTCRDYGFKDIFETFKTTIINGDFLHLKKKIHVDAYVDTKDYFDKYFEMGTILTIFFTWIILILNSKKIVVTFEQLTI